ncbi:OmpA family protein [Indibacter alkaliphilus]|nr:OmpA family protein [Indibacter alkaliphilus]
MMNNYRNVIIVFSLILLNGCTLFKGGNLKTAKENERMFNYSIAKESYMAAYEKKESETALRGLANTSLKLREFEQAESWFSRLERSGLMEAIDYYQYATVLQANAKFDEALHFLEKYKSSGDEEIGTEKLTVLEESLKMGKTILNSESNIALEPVAGVNTEYSEFGFIYDENRPLFVSDRLDNKDGRINTRNAFKSERYGWTGNGFLSVFTLSYDFETNSGSTVEKVEDYQHPYHIGPVYESEVHKFHIKTEPVSGGSPFSFKRNDITVFPGMYHAHLQEDGEWSEEKGFGFNSPLEYMVIDPFWDKDGKTLFFASDMPGGYGGLDLYKVTLLTDSTWTEPENLGSNYNTIGNERSPFIYDEDFYFSSDGHPGLGGLDVFLIRDYKNNRGTIENLKAPINSNRDDFFFTRTDTDYAFLSSDREGGKGSDDIYRIQYNIQEFVLLMGEVLAKDTGNPISNAVVTAVNKDTGVNFRYVTNEEGKFEFQVPVRTPFGISATATDYMRAQIDEALKGDKSEQDAGQKFVQLYLDKMEREKIYTVENIFYDFDKWDIREDAKPELVKLAYILLENPTLKIELHSHTDSRGTEKYNQRLSDRRAQSAVDFIVSLGVSKNRISAKGYGESQLKNHCKDGVDCSDDEHQENRRTEFKILDY